MSRLCLFKHATLSIEKKSKMFMYRRSEMHPMLQATVMTNTTPSAFSLSLFLFPFLGVGGGGVGG